MGHRKWTLFGAGAESMEGAMREHNALYDAWEVERDRADDLLKDRNAIQQKLDAARKHITELESPTRVPFSDAQIERMARTAREVLLPGDPEYNVHWPHWHDALRAALAAGGLVPCAVPEYAPDDVALRPSDADMWQTELRVACSTTEGDYVLLDNTDPEYANLVAKDSESCSRSLVSIAPRDGARMAAWLSSYAAAHGVPSAPTGHVLRDRLVEAEHKIANQRMSLRQMHEARERDARLIAELRDEVDEDNTNAASVNDLLVQVQNLTAECGHKDKGWSYALKQWEEALGELNEAKKQLAALHPGETVEGVIAERDHYRIRLERAESDLRERASVPVKVRLSCSDEDLKNEWLRLSKELGGYQCPELQDWCHEGLMRYRDYLAAHAVVDAPAGVPSVEELMAEGQLAYVANPGNHQIACMQRTIAIRDAVLAAIAHLSTRPDGLPTAEELAKTFTTASNACYWNVMTPYGQKQTIKGVDAIIAALRPWLRDPVGCELDVTVEEAREAWGKAYGHPEGVQAILDLCRKRNKPVYECKECEARREHMLTAPEVKCAECELRSDDGIIQALMGERDHWIQEAQDAIKFKDKVLIAWKKLAARAVLEGE